MVTAMLLLVIGGTSVFVVSQQPDPEGGFASVAEAGDERSVSTPAVAKRDEDRGEDFEFASKAAPPASEPMVAAKRVAEAEIERGAQVAGADAKLRSQSAELGSGAKEKGAASASKGLKPVSNTVARLVEMEGDRFGGEDSKSGRGGARKSVGAKARARTRAKPMAVAGGKKRAKAKQMSPRPDRMARSALSHGSAKPGLVDAPSVAQAEMSRAPLDAADDDAMEEQVVSNSRSASADRAVGEVAQGGQEVSQGGQEGPGAGRHTGQAARGRLRASPEEGRYEERREGTQASGQDSRLWRDGQAQESQALEVDEGADQGKEGQGSTTDPEEEEAGGLNPLGRGSSDG